MPVQQFQPNANRYDPYKAFKFRIKWDGKVVAGVSKVSGLTRTTEVVTHREGEPPPISHGSAVQTEYRAILLERGVTYDPDFEAWANKVWSRANTSSGQEVSLRDFRKDIIIELYDEAGQKVLAYNVYRCWVSEYHALPELDASSNAVAIQSIKLENEGWERDTSVSELNEPSF